MAYILIFDLDGNSEQRRRINRQLGRCAQMVQQSVWRFENYGALLDAAESVLAADGKVLAFIESDRIVLMRNEVRQLFKGTGKLVKCPK